MDSKAQTIKLFLDNYRIALDQVECKTMHDRFLIDLLLKQHQKATHAFELLNWFGEQRNFDTLYENIFEQYGLVNTGSDHHIHSDNFSYSSIEHLFNGRLLKYQYAVVLHNNELFLVNHSERTVQVIIRRPEKSDEYNQLQSALQIVNRYHDIANVDQSYLISSLTGLPQLPLKLRNIDTSKLLFDLLQIEIGKLYERRISYNHLKNEILEMMGPLLFGTLFYAAVLAVEYVAFHVILPVILAFAVFGAGAVVLLGCAALIPYGIEKYIQHSVTKINEHNNFTKTYDYEFISAQSEASTMSSSLTTELSDDKKRIKISIPNSPLHFFNNRTQNGASKLFESVTNCYNS
jgi:hypothetical protein